MTRILRTIDPRDTAKMRRIQGLCLREHIMPPPVAYVGARVYQCPPHLLVNGKIPEGLKLDELGIAPALVYDARSQSWVRNAYNIVTQQLCALHPYSLSHSGTGAGSLYNLRTSGAIHSNASYLDYIRGPGDWVGGLGDTTQGIVVGTDTGAEDFNDYALGTLVAHGTGAGQLSYAAQEATTRAYTAGTLTWAGTLIRYLNNNSGGAIVIGEVGLYVCVSASPDEMLCRDLIDPTVSVANTAQLKVTYTITSMAYPS